jgi:hypothetical protein
MFTRFFGGKCIVTEVQEKRCFIGGNMDTREAIVQLVKDLMASDNGLLPFTLYKRYGVTPMELVQMVKRLQSKGYLQIQTNNRLVLTKDGRENAEGFIASMSRIARARMDSTYFINIAGNLLDRRTPFLPSRRFFEQIKKEGVKNG